MHKASKLNKPTFSLSKYKKLQYNKENDGKQVNDTVGIKFIAFHPKHNFVFRFKLFFLTLVDNDTLIFHSLTSKY